jgi:hypothetical protein
MIEPMPPTEDKAMVRIDSLIPHEIRRWFGPACEACGDGACLFPTTCYLISLDGIDQVPGTGDAESKE